MSADVDITTWLTELGYGLPQTLATARATLEAHGLTRPGKQRLSEAKVERAREALEAALVRHCTSPECLVWARSTLRAPVACSPRSACERCGGSHNQRAVTELIELCRQSGVKKVVIVGGAPSTRQELEQAVGSALELRLVDGVQRRPQEKAKADVAWADLVLVWGGTELHHAVSKPYTDSREDKVVHIVKRGVAQLLAGATEHLKRRAR